MKFSVSANELYDAMREAKRVIPRSSTMPIMEMIRLEKTGEGISLRGTDGQLFIERELDVSHRPMESGADVIAIPAQRTIDTLSALPDIPVEITVGEEHGIRIETEQGVYEMVGKPGADFPEVPDETVIDSLPATRIKEGIDRTSFAVGEDALRPAMMGVLLDGSTNNVVATDGHQLSRYSTEIPIEENVILSQDGVSLMQRFIGEGSTLKITQGYGILDAEETTVFFPRIDAPYPNYESVIPDNNDKTLRVNREDLEGAVTRATIYTSSLTNQIRFSISPNRVTVAAQDNERRSEAEESIYGDYDGDPMDIGFNGNYIQNLLGNIDTEEVLFKLGSPNRAATVFPDNDEDHLMLIMPVMLDPARAQGAEEEAEAPATA